ncbi:Fatty acyl- reductase 1 [Chlorella sorokiniana]|uniref:Fatty acyl-CoA reductase n=1 Tax=Chlorella sorokiniana TaxID=3076 RepID=A0A2P6TWL3_CHLSO|nr:Fatty acyl- reductase 1 [Chlorella sorokiniana]|eukprot:PRW58462.1 Fatty acyl- reductase 1 [Chlorella sorokiniana]
MAKTEKLAWRPPPSVRDKLASGTWLLTGATGFLGSTIIEQLLRNASPRKLVLVVLPKKGTPVMDQVAKLLTRPLFDRVRAQYGGSEELLKRFEAVEVDLSEGKLPPLPAADFVVHASELVSAAAAAMPNLKAYVHVSTCYVNGNLPRGTYVPEEPVGTLVGPNGEGPFGYREMVEELMALPHDEAEKRAEYYRVLLGFPNNYCITKRMAECLMYERAAEGLPLRILRPSIVGGASLNHIMPGYIGNAGGSTAYALGIAFGMFACTEWIPEHITDLMPVDYVTNGIIMAAAAEPTEKGAPPLILQAATSAVDPMRNEQFYSAATRAVAAKPPPLTVFPGCPKPSMSQIHCKTAEEYRAALKRSDASTALRGLLMRLMGQGATAAAIATRYNVFKVVSCTEERVLFRCVWIPGQDEWEPYLDSYMEAIWERYVTPAGRARAEKRSRAVKKAATVAAVAAGAVAVAAVPLLVGVARASNLPGYS